MILIDIDRCLNMLELTYSKYNNDIIAVLSLISLAPLHMRAERVVPSSHLCARARAHTNKLAMMIYPSAGKCLEASS